MIPSTPLPLSLNRFHPSSLVHLHHRLFFNNVYSTPILTLHRRVLRYKKMEGSHKRAVQYKVKYWSEGSQIVLFIFLLLSSCGVK